MESSDQYPTGVSGLEVSTDGIFLKQALGKTRFQPSNTLVIKAQNNNMLFGQKPLTPGDARYSRQGGYYRSNLYPQSRFCPK